MGRDGLDDFDEFDDDDGADRPRARAARALPTTLLAARGLMFLQAASPLLLVGAGLASRDVDSATTTTTTTTTLAGEEAASGGGGGRLLIFLLFVIMMGTMIFLGARLGKLRRSTRVAVTVVEVLILGSTLPRALSGELFGPVVVISAVAVLVLLYLPASSTAFSPPDSGEGGRFDIRKVGS